MLVTAAPVNTPTDLISQLIDEAADLIEERGWCQHTEENMRGELCTVGALQRVMYERSYPDEYHALACDRLAAIMGSSPIDWNDRSHRTKDDVLRTMRLAARL